MLNNKNKKQLKSLANNIKIKYQIGKDNIDDSVIKLLNNALIAHELIKISFQKSVIKDIDKLKNQIVTTLNAELVDQIGHTIILYRANLEKKNRIILS